jgi:hypothetical protein
MELEAILKQLREELVDVNTGILVFERLAAGKPRGRGRPPKWLAQVKEAAPKRRGRPLGAAKAKVAAKREYTSDPSV